jgi:hypothetical protein
MGRPELVGERTTFLSPTLRAEVQAAAPFGRPELGLELAELALFEDGLAEEVHRPSAVVGRLRTVVGG